MNPPKASAELPKVLGILEIWRAATTAGKQSESVRLVSVQGIPLVISKGCDQRNLIFHQFPGEIMLLQDGLVIPAFRSVELGDDRGFLFEPDPLDSVFITIECQ